MATRSLSIAAGICVASSFLVGGVTAIEGPGARATSLISPIGDPIDGRAGGVAGASVAITADGSRVIIGEPANSPFPGLPAGSNLDGSARVFDNINGQWVQVGGELTRKTPGDQFGGAVSISADGSRVAVGARDDGPESTGAGYARVFELRDGSWLQLGSDISGLRPGDSLGKSISLSADGSRLAVGAPRNDGADASATDIGNTQIYDWDGNQWNLEATIYGAVARDLAGSSLSLSSDGTRLAIGSPQNDDGGNFSGHVQVFEETSTGWERVGDPIPGVDEDNYFGESVSLSGDGNRLAAGAFGNDNDNGAFAGHTRVFDWDGSNWVAVGSEIIGEAASDQSGQSVSLSADGTRLAVGAPTNTGNGTDAGHVRVFELVAGSWFQLQPDIDSVTPGDRFGISVAMNATGSVLAAGAFRHGTNLEGHVRVFSIGALTVAVGPSTDTRANQTKNAESGTPGIFLTVLARPGHPATRVDVLFGAYAIVPSSLFVVSVRSGDPSAPNGAVWREGVTSAGHLEKQIQLPPLGPGQHTITVRAQGAGGESLILGNQISVSPQGIITSLTPEALQPTIR